MERVDENNEMDNFFTQITKANDEWLKNLIGNQDGSSSNPYLSVYQGFCSNAKNYLEAQTNFYQEQLAMWQEFYVNTDQLNVNQHTRKVMDKRFSDPDWENNPFFSYLKQSYLNVSKHLLGFIENMQLDAETKFRIDFFIRQYLDAISPSNFMFTNPEVIKAMLETKGKSLSDGMRNMMADIQNGYIAMTDESQFKVGENLAVTPGAVVYKNELIELIQYSPTTDKVRQIPLLIVPPCINKYYILDLQQSNSLVKYLVDQGFSVFLVSWKSADNSIKHFNFEEYAEKGVIQAIEVVRAISDQDKINTLGYCIGGIILTIANILLKNKKVEWVNSMTHITTMLDHGEPGDIKAFLDRDIMKLREAKRQHGGIMSGRIIGQTFSSLRANELIWNYWVNNYLLGRTPHKFDILYWNNDTVDLPIPMHSALMEELYLDNKLVQGKFKIHDRVMRLESIDCPVYLFATQKDHIVPWISAYKTISYLTNAESIRFVLGASGHTAGVVNPVQTNKRNYWVNSNLAPSSQEWFNGATEKPGSWWSDLSLWLMDYAGEEVNIKALGSKDYSPLYNAPGEYVKAESLSLIEAESI